MLRTLAYDTSGVVENTENNKLIQLCEEHGSLGGTKIGSRALTNDDRINNV